MEKEKVYVYVQAPDGTPLMPTTRYRMVKHALKDGRAKVVSRIPFTIRLMYEPKTRIVQPISLGIDPGRTNIGVAAVKNSGVCVYRAHITTRNKQIPKLIEKRKEHRDNSKYGERLRRKRRAKKNSTLITDEFIDRKLPGYSDLIRIKDIINTEAKFINKKKPKGWLTPTATQLLRTHINVVKKVCKILPVSKVCLEINKFSFMCLDNPTVKKKDIDFQHGPLYGYSDLHTAVHDMQNGTCLLCGKSPIEHYHHVISTRKNGSDTYTNIAGLCEKCHEKVHKNIKAKEKLDMLHTKRNKKYGALSVLNQIIPFLVNDLSTIFPNNTYITWGYYTKRVREDLGLAKDHDIDAYCIAVQSFYYNHIKIDCSMPAIYEIAQFRRQNRAIINNQRERTYKLNGVVVAKNRRKRTDQFDDSLHEWYIKTKEKYGKEEARRLQSNLKVYKSKPSYNNMNRILPGAVFKCGGSYYILRGQKHNGYYYISYGQRNKFHSNNCVVSLFNGGLVYVPR